MRFLFFVFLFSVCTPSELGPLNHKFHFLSVRSFCIGEKKKERKKERGEASQTSTAALLSLSRFSLRYPAPRGSLRWHRGAALQLGASFLRGSALEIARVYLNYYWIPFDFRTENQS